ncbi:MAG TPA: site-2 protease family protein [Candidatus Polarisedimenticolia bacterium]|nr:site-2 protease family protein [Candidatus Polarisedimenticolia bacterium]
MPPPPKPITGQLVRRGRDRLALHALLFVGTFYTMTMAGALSSPRAFLADPGSLGTQSLLDPAFLSLGLSYSVCLIAILGVHEMGHYLACRHYGVDASLPYFLPSVPLFGTFGAFIRIRAPIPDRRVLFDVGVAGPLAGFAVALPILIYGVMHPQLVPVVAEGASAGEPLLMLWLGMWLSPPVPDGYVPLLSGPLMAGWVGCLATALNLFPIGQLDGGHICYAISARFHRAVSMAALVAFVLLGLVVYPGWLVFATLLVMFGSWHPPVLDESKRLPAGRVLLAAVSLAVLALCFIPEPFSF